MVYLVHPIHIQVEELPLYHHVYVKLATSPLMQPLAVQVHLPFMVIVPICILEHLYCLSSPTIECPTGRFKSISGGASCTNCPAGKYSNETGSQSCKLCSAGYMGDEEESSPLCTALCAAGYYCPIGLESNNLASYQCPQYYTSNVGATQLSDCYIDSSGNHLPTAS
jgi:hypothetical protein